MVDRAGCDRTGLSQTGNRDSDNLSGGPGGVRGDSVAENGFKIGTGCRLIGF